MITWIGEKLTLSDGNQMPGFGYGCYKATGRELLVGLASAWEFGYRLFDTAAFYDNEETVGEGLAQKQPEHYFLISKIWPTAFGQPVRALDASLRKLRRAYLDAYLLHWPGTSEKLMLKAWEALLRVHETGKIRSLGVSNFLVHHLEAIKREFGAWPALNQIESHPVFANRELVAYCQDHKITVMAWGPLGRGEAMKNPKIAEIAKTLGKTPAQVVLRWQLQGGKVPIPKSVHPERVHENAEVFDFELTAGQMAAIDALNRPDGNTSHNPDTFAG